MSSVDSQSLYMSVKVIVTGGKLGYMVQYQV